MTDVHRNEPNEKPERLKSFARDVTINIIANLAAAGIIYLSAVSAGYIRARPVVLVIAVGLVLPGILSVFLFVVGSLKYMKSSRDPSNISSAKNTIVYGVVIFIGVYGIWLGTPIGAALRRHGGLLRPIGGSGFVLVSSVIAASLILKRRGPATTSRVLTAFAFILVALLALGALLGAVFPRL